MKPKVVALAFSDLHINLWTKFNDSNKRTLDHFRVLSLIKKKCLKYGCPALFCGDLFHKPEGMSQDLMHLAFSEMQKLEGDFRIYAISGNHDIAHNNSVKNPQLSYVKLMERYNFMRCIDFHNVEVPSSGIRIYGVPYLDHNLDLNEYIKGLTLSDKTKNILLLHTDYPGAKDTDGVEVGSCENLNTNLLQKFDLTLIGHIHKPQRLGKKVVMVGAPLQQRRTDKACSLGYWKIYSDMSVKFCPFSFFPKFIDVDSEDKIKDDGNYYTVISKLKEVEVTENKVTRDLSKKKLVKEYLKAKGIADKNKKRILLNIIKEAEE